MASTEKILLCGFMGSGKSSVIERLNFHDGGGEWVFEDLDQLIYENWATGFKQLGDWIESVGWERFRMVEGEMLAELLADSKKRVLALGGGTVEHHGKILENWYSSMVWIDVDFAVCWERVKQNTNRPMVKLGKNALETLYEQRLEGYKKAQVHLNQIESELLDSVGQLLSRLE